VKRDSTAFTTREIGDTKFRTGSSTNASSMTVAGFTPAGTAPPDWPSAGALFPRESPGAGQSARIRFVGILAFRRVAATESAKPRSRPVPRPMAEGSSARSLPVEVIDLPISGFAGGWHQRNHGLGIRIAEDFRASLHEDAV